MQAFWLEPMKRRKEVEDWLAETPYETEAMSKSDKRELVLKVTPSSTSDIINSNFNSNVTYRQMGIGVQNAALTVQK